MMAQAKFILGASALLGLYLGGLSGAWLCVHLGISSSLPLLACLSAFALMGAGLAFAAGRRLLGEAARHARFSSVLIFLVPAAAGLCLAQWLLGLAGWRLPAFLQNMVLWLAAVAAVWAEEPVDR